MPSRSTWCQGRLTKALDVLNMETPAVELPIANWVPPEMVMAGVPESVMVCGPMRTWATSALARLSARLAVS